MAAPNPECDLEDLLAQTQAHAFKYLSTLEKRSVAATVNVETLRRRLDTPLAADGLAADRVIDELVAATEGGHLGSAGGRFFGGVLPSALAAYWLVSTCDNNAALYTCGSAAAVYEEVAGARVKDILRLPSESSFAFTTGFQMAHVTCLAAARHALLATRGWDVEQGGLFGASPLRVLANEM